MHICKRSLIIFNILCFLLTFSFTNAIYYTVHPQEPKEVHAVVAVDDGVILIIAVTAIVLSMFSFADADSLNYTVQEVINSMSEFEKWAVTNAYKAGEKIFNFAKWVLVKIKGYVVDAFAKTEKKVDSEVLPKSKVYTGAIKKDSTGKKYYPFFNYGLQEAPSGIEVPAKCVDESLTEVITDGVTFYIESPNTESYTYLIARDGTNSKQLGWLWGSKRAFVEIRESGQFWYRAVTWDTQKESWILAGNYIKAYFTNNPTDTADAIESPTVNENNKDVYYSLPDTADVDSEDVVGISIPDGLTMNDLQEMDLSGVSMPADIMDTGFTGTYDLTGSPDLLGALETALDYGADNTISATGTKVTDVAKDTTTDTTTDTTKDTATDTTTDATDTGTTDTDTDLEIDWSPIYSVGSVLKNVFPFCLPFDLYNILSFFDADAIAPKFVLDFSSFPLVSNLSYTLDFSQFDSMAKLARSCEVVLYIIFLVFVTKKIIS